MDMDLKELIQTIANIGFPGAIALFVLWRIEPAIKGLTSVIEKLDGKFEIITTFMDKK